VARQPQGSGFANTFGVGVLLSLAMSVAALRRGVIGEICGCFLRNLWNSRQSFVDRLLSWRNRAIHETARTYTNEAQRLKMQSDQPNGSSTRSKKFEMIEGWHMDSVEVVRLHWERILKLNLSVSFTVIVPPATEGALMP